MLRRVIIAPVEDWLGVIVFLALFLLMAVNVFSRYVLNTGIGWSEEISRYLLVWLVYLGIGTGIRAKSHVRIDLIDRLVGSRTRALLNLLNFLLLAGFLIALCWIFSDLIGRFSGLRSPASGLSMAYAYAAVLTGAALGLFRLVVQCFPPRPIGPPLTP